MASLKLFFNIVLFTVAMAYYESMENLRKCPTTSRHLLAATEKPIDYDINFEINTETKVEKGSVNITVHVKKPTMKITLHSRGLEVIIKQTWIKTLEYEIQENTTQNIYDIEYCPIYDVLILVFGNILHPGRYLLHIEYVNFFHQKLGEVQQPFIWTGKNEWLFTNLYKSGSTREIFPCWDDPAIKASFRIRICYPAKHRAFSNMPAWLEFKDEPDNIICANFWASQVKPVSYLAIGVFDNIIMNPLSDEINHVWHQPNSTEILRYLHKTLTSIMSYFPEHVDVHAHDVIKKIDHVVLPNSLMKSTGRPGLIIYREKDVQYDNNTDKTLSGKRVDIMKLVAYEIARQWFVSLGLDNDIMINNNELLAAFYGYHVVAKIISDPKYMELFVVENIQTALDSDIFIDETPMKDRVDNTDKIDALLHSRLYRKKAFALIRMLFHILTPQKFQEGIIKYVQACVLFPHGKENLWDFLQEVYPEHKNHRYTIKEIINSWLSTRFHPELRFQRIPGQSKVEYYSTYPTKKYEIEWKIPITYITLTTQSNTNISYNTSNVIWFEFSERKNLDDIKLEDFFIVNLEQIGYYRVNYDSRNWQSISTYLNHPIKYKNIPVLNRAQIINDAYHFIRKGDLNISIFLNITQYLRWETDYIAWYPMFNIFSHMSKFFNYASSERIKLHFLRLLNALLKNVGYVNLSQDDDMMMSLKLLAIKWSCKMNILECYDAASMELSHYIDYPESHFDEIPVMLEDWTLCSGTSATSIETWNILLREAIRYHKKLFKYLACCEKEDIIIHYLDLMMTSDYKEHIGGEICRLIIKKHANKNAVLNYLLQNHTMIKSRYPVNFPRNDLLSTVIMSVYSKTNLEKIYRVIEKDFEGNIAFYYLTKLINMRKDQINKEQSAFNLFW